jgi:hypothetical protein
MTNSRFYRFALPAPLILPFLVGGLARLTSSIPGVGPFLIVPTVVLFTSLVYIRWTYPAFALATLFWTRGRTAPELERISLWLPLLYAPLCGIEASVNGDPITGPGATWRANFLAATVAAIVFGYLYVGAARLAADLLFRRNNADSGGVPLSSSGA